MTDDDRHYGEGDRLPWLETVEEEERRSSSAAGRTIALVLLGLLVIAGIVWGLYTLQGARSPSGSGELIAAQEGDYKIKPEDPGGLKVEGEGDSAVAASGGESPNGSIDLRAVPEAPITGPRATAGATPAPAGSAKASASVPQASAPLTAERPMATPTAAVPGAASGGALVQLGAYPTEAAANAAWSAIARRFSYVASLGKQVQRASVNDRTVYRLRVNAGSADAAADVCGRLRVAGERCFVAS